MCNNSRTGLCHENCAFNFFESNFLNTNGRCNRGCWWGSVDYRCNDRGYNTIISSNGLGPHVISTTWSINIIITCEYRCASFWTARLGCRRHSDQRRAEIESIMLLETAKNRKTRLRGADYSLVSQRWREMVYNLSRLELFDPVPCGLEMPMKYQ